MIRSVLALLFAGIAAALTILLLPSPSTGPSIVAAVATIVLFFILTQNPKETP